MPPDLLDAFLAVFAPPSKSTPASYLERRNRLLDQGRGIGLNAIGTNRLNAAVGLLHRASASSVGDGFALAGPHAVGVLLQDHRFFRERLEFRVLHGKDFGNLEHCLLDVPRRNIPRDDLSLRDWSTPPERPRRGQARTRAMRYCEAHSLARIEVVAELMALVEIKQSLVQTATAYNPLMQTATVHDPLELRQPFQLRIVTPPMLVAEAVEAIARRGLKNSMLDLAIAYSLATYYPMDMLPVALAAIALRRGDAFLSKALPTLNETNALRVLGHWGDYTKSWSTGPHPWSPPLSMVSSVDAVATVRQEVERALTTFRACRKCSRYQPHPSPPTTATPR